MSAKDPLQYHVVRPAGPHEATIVFLHGLGDRGDGIMPLDIVNVLGESLPNVKWILPHAPVRPITINRAKMPGWFDLRSLELADSTHDDEPGLLTAVDLVDDLIQDEIDTGTPENKIVLGGISQGGAIAILHCITKGRPLAGVVALSTWITLGPRIAEISKPSAKEVPVFLAHGKADELIEYQYGERAIEILTTQLGFPRLPCHFTFKRPGVRFASYDELGHAVDEEELEDLAEWLQCCLAE